VKEHSFVSGRGLHVANEEMGAGEVIVEDVEGGFKGRVQGKGGDCCGEGWRGWFRGWSKGWREGQDVSVQRGERSGWGGCRHDCWFEWEVQRKESSWLVVLVNDVIILTFQRTPVETWRQVTLWILFKSLAKTCKLTTKRKAVADRNEATR